MTQHSCAPLTIFEGPDGGGKTTAARSYAELTGAVYFHLGPFPRLSTNLARMYVEVLMPAVLGHRAVVLDRSWLSEKIYGQVFRNGTDRLGIETVRIIERLAFRCQTLVVLCVPRWEAVLGSFRRRKGEEMLDREEQLRQVYDLYDKSFATSLPTVRWDYEQTPLNAMLFEGDRERPLPHPAKLRTAGNWDAGVVLVGEDFAELKDQDAFYQWPFGSLSGAGCSRWLAKQLDEAGIGENQLLWINADNSDEDLHRVVCDAREIITLGTKAEMRMRALGYTDVVHAAPHPQFWRRFHRHQPYPLLPLLKELTDQ